MFCNGAGTVGPRVWPDWLSARFPDIGELGGSPSNPQLSPRLVCASCHGGWMAALDHQASRILTPVLAGETSVITCEQSKVLAGWLCLLAVKLAAAHSACVIPRSELVYLRHTGRPPHTWSIFVAGLCEAGSPGSLRHHPCRIEFSGHPLAGHSKGRLTAACNSQMLSIGIGPLFFHLFSSPSLVGLHDFAAASRQQGLIPLWPSPRRFGVMPRREVRLPPDQALTSEAASRVADGFAARLKMIARATPGGRRI
jgi:hypothetical protein